MKTVRLKDAINFLYTKGVEEVEKMGTLDGNENWFSIEGPSFTLLLPGNKNTLGVAKFTRTTTEEIESLSNRGKS